MREVHRRQFEFGQVPVEKIWIDPKSRVDIPAVLKGLQHIWSTRSLRCGLRCSTRMSCRRPTGRSGVRGLADPGAGGGSRVWVATSTVFTTSRTITRRCARSWGTAISATTYYEYQTVLDNVCLLTPELLSEVGRLVVESGHAVEVRTLASQAARAVCSFVVDTCTYPDVSLLWDAMPGRPGGRPGTRRWGGGAAAIGQGGQELFNQVRSTRRAKRRPERVEAYLARCRAPSGPWRPSTNSRDKGVEETTCQSIQGFIAHAAPVSQVERRLLRGEAIASRGEGVLGLRGAYSSGSCTPVNSGFL